LPHRCPGWPGIIVLDQEIPDKTVVGLKTSGELVELANVFTVSATDNEMREIMGITAVHYRVGIAIVRWKAKRGFEFLIFKAELVADTDNVADFVAHNVEETVEMCDSEVAITE
jgi:hypothetical protein